MPLVPVVVAFAVGRLNDNFGTLGYFIVGLLPSAG
jgi:hypothetical protein